MSKLELKNVTKTFGGVFAVNNVSLGFDGGHVYGLIGPNGAGKTTIFNLISGLLCPTRGSIHYDGKEISGRESWHIAQLGVGRLFQDVRVFDRLTAKENILTAFRKQKGENLFVSIFRRREMEKDERRLGSRLELLLESVGLTEVADSLAVNLSYGQQKLLALARLLAADMDVLLLDEPAAGISPQMVRTILELIRRLAGEGKTVIIIEHNMNLVSECVDEVFFMDEGRVVSSGTPQTVLGSPELKTAYLGI